jgi:hypothetical protein
MKTILVGVSLFLCTCLSGVQRDGGGCRVDTDCAAALGQLCNRSGQCVNAPCDPTHVPDDCLTVGVGLRCDSGQCVLPCALAYGGCPFGTVCDGTICVHEDTGSLTLDTVDAIGPGAAGGAGGPPPTIIPQEPPPYYSGDAY